jgi:dihydrofolate synthase / folylpolyglutamate synthase
MNYQEALDYLYARLPVFHHIGAQAYKPGLENTQKLLTALGQPHEKFKAIHIAGTNGKGSVSHYLSAILQSAGYKTGLYTSPHLVDFGERIRIDGKMIDRDYVIGFTEQNKALFEEIQPSFFEATMAMAFCYFADQQVDIAVIETGLGGRLDSTNIITPLLSVITNISFDHTGFLGDTLEKIAFEKAGIIKQNVPVVIGESLPETQPVFERQATKTGSPVFYADAVLSVDGYNGSKMSVKSSNDETFVSGLCGDYQLRNIATVLKSIEVFNQTAQEGLCPVEMKQVLFGLENVCELTGLRGRWEKLREQPLIITDTGHNTAGIKYVVDQLLRQTYTRLHIIIGMVNDKDISSVLDLLPREALYYFTNATVQRALPAAELKQKAESKHLKGEAYPCIPKAIGAALQHALPTDLIFIGGSNFVVGEAMAYWSNI